MTAMASERPKAQLKLDNLSRRIRAVREALRLTVIEAAAKSKVSRTSFHLWERGTIKMPNRDNLGHFAKAADISLDWLLTGSGDKPAVLTGARRGDAHSAGDRDNEPIPEISGSMAAHATAIDLTARAHWTIPADVLQLGFNADPGDLVMQRVVTSDDVLGKGEYILIDTRRNRVDEPGIYLLAGRDGLPAERIHNPSVAETEGRAVLGRIMGVLRPA